MKRPSGALLEMKASAGAAAISADRLSNMRPVILATLMQVVIPAFFTDTNLPYSIFTGLISLFNQGLCDDRLSIEDRRSAYQALSRVAQDNQALAQGWVGISQNVSPEVIGAQAEVNLRSLLCCPRRRHATHLRAAYANLTRYLDVSFFGEMSLREPALLDRLAVVLDARPSEGVRRMVFNCLQAYILIYREDAEVPRAASAAEVGFARKDHFTRLEYAVSLLAFKHVPDTLLRELYQFISNLINADEDGGALLGSRAMENYFSVDASGYSFAFYESFFAGGYL